MSKTTDAERREARVELAIQRAKKDLGVWALVLAHFTEGLTEEQSAERLGVSRSAVHFTRRVRLRLPMRRDFYDKEIGDTECE